ncbi:MAG: hypothetical protein QI197_01890 [Candidatus Korarchaeota archaeon]|nr:hypothetical protein [Candidatus Korarchaeota archaeon]
MKHERRPTFKVGSGKRSPIVQLSLAKRLGVDTTYVAALRSGIFEEK